MLKKIMVIVSIIMLVVFGAIEVSADTSDMTEAKLLLISETKEEINRSNRVIEEKELDDSKYYSELGDIVAVGKDGSRITLIRQGRFALEGTEGLNEALD